jgi:two-component system OmpR family sensor kinase
VVRVVNGGPVVPAEQLETLTDRFVSYGGQGSGLGLAIVQAIAQQIGATLELRSPATGRADGFESRLALPPAPDGARAAPPPVMLAAK